MALLAQRYVDPSTIVINRTTLPINSQMKEWFFCRPQYIQYSDHENHTLTPERNQSTICRASCLFHYAVTCYYKHIHSLCFSTQMQPCRDNSYTSSHVTRQNVKQLWFRRRQESISVLPPSSLSMKSISVLGVWYSSGWVRVTMKNPKAISWFNFKSLPCRFYLTPLQKTTNWLLFIYSYIQHMDSTKHQKQWCLTIYSNVVHKLVLSVIVRVQSGSVFPAVLAASGSAAADGIVLTVRQAVQTKLNQDNFLLVCGEEGAGPYWTLSDKERRLRLALESIQHQTVTHFVLL